MGKGMAPTEQLLLQRKQWDRCPIPVEPDITVRQQSIGTLRCEWINAPEPGEAVILYLHGGGFTKGSLDSHRELVSRVARASNARVFNVEYRLAPEATFPAQREDAMTAYRFLLSEGIDPKALVVAGDSAGGGLAVLLLVAVRDEGLPLPAAAFAMSPLTDLTLGAESFRTRAHVDPYTREGVGKVVELYLGGADARDPKASPLFADLRGLPPLLLQAGDYEVLLDDTVRLAKRATDAGVAVTLEVFDKMSHVFQMNSATDAESRRAISQIGDFVRQHAKK